VSGALAPCGDTAAFVRQAAALAGDLERVRRIGANARAAAGERGWERVVRELEDALAGAADQRSASLPFMNAVPLTRTTRPSFVNSTT